MNLKKYIHESEEIYIYESEYNYYVGPSAGLYKVGK